jgi:8-oxo-dGTP diphosphatase
MQFIYPMIRDVAVILLYDKENKILFQHRDEEMERLPGYWAFFGGGIDKGETPEQAVKRETLEELNYKLKDPQLVITQEFKGLNHEGTKYVFVEKYDPSKKLELNEGKDMAWLFCKEFLKRKIVDHDKEIIEVIRKQFEI